MERNLDTKDEKIQKLKEEKEYLEITRSEQGNTIDETATLIRELRDKLLESQSDVNKLKRRLEGEIRFLNIFVKINAIALIFFTITFHLSHLV